MEGSTAKRGNTRIIASNSFWSGLELVSSVVVTFATSVPMARVIGPERMGYFNYIQWLINLSGMVGLLGIPGATRKYMAEYVGSGQPEVAGAVFRATLKLQVAIASALTALGLVLVAVGAEPEYRLIAILLVLSLWPGMVASVPSQANVAAERMAFNTAGSLASYVVNIAAVTISLLRGWNLLGIAAGVLAFRTVDCAVRLLLARHWMRGIPHAPLAPNLKRRMTTFSGYSLVLMVLNMIVLDRSDVVFLRKLGHDTAQIAYFTVALGMIDKIQAIPSAFTSAAHATIMAQFGRDRSELPRVAASALWYSFAFSTPLLLGLAAISSQLMPFLYGARYEPAVPLLAVAALLAIPKCFTYPAWAVMEANSRQGFMVLWLIVCAVTNILLDVLLIPRYGAMGAVIANGTAQTLLPLGLVWRTQFLFGLNLRLADATRLLLSASIMAALVLATSSRFHASWTMAIEVVLGVVVFTACMRITGALQGEDRQRLLLLEATLPAPLRSPFARVVLFLAPVSPR